MAKSISIIIPTLNEEKLLPAVLQHLRGYEVIVVDGGGADRTVEIAKNFGAKVLISNANTSISKNMSSKIASGDILIHLDADTILTREHVRKIVEVMRDKSVSGGTFRLYPYDGKWYHCLFLTILAIVLRILGKLPVNSKPRVLGSIIFMRKEAFEKAGGYWDNPVAEDQYVAKKLANLGKFIMLNMPVYTSARRWVKWGFFKAIAIMAINSLMSVTLNKTWFKKW